MLFLTLFVSVLSALVSAQSGANPLVPISGTIQAGQPTTIKWQPNTPGTISLTLRWGSSASLEKGVSIASGLANSGSYTWTPPTQLKGESDYTIEIISDSDSSQTNYSPVFTINSSGSGISSSASSSTGSSSSKTSSGSASSTSSSDSSTSTTSTTSTSTSSSTTTTTSTSKASSASHAPTSNAGNKVGGGFAAVVGMGALVAAL